MQYVSKMACVSKKNTRESRFSNPEKQDIADIICNEEPVNAEEPILVKLRSKSLSNKVKTALYKIVCDQPVERGLIKSVLLGEYIKAKDTIKTKSGVKNSPWVLTIAEAMKRYRCGARQSGPKCYFQVRKGILWEGRLDVAESFT